MLTTALPAFSIQQLEYVVAVTRHSTWAEAAASIGVTPSALSQGISELERRLGLTVFERDGRRRRPGPNAAEVIAYAETVVAQTADLAAWAERARRGRAGQVRIGMIDIAATHHFPAELRHYRGSRPDIDLLLHVAPSRALLEEVSAATLDAAVVVEPPQPTGDLQLEPLLVEPLGVYGPPESASKDPPSDWGPWVLFPAGAHTREIIERALGHLGARVEIVGESNQPDVLRAMVQLGLGWTVLPAPQAEIGVDPLHAARKRPLATRQLSIARRHGAIADPSVEALLDALRDKASKL